MRYSHIAAFTVCLFIAAGTTGTVSSADITLPALFGDNMVMQRNRSIRLHGRADPGEQITVAFRAVKKNAVAGADGTWEIILDPMKAGGPYDMVIEGNNRLRITDILIGDVWVCSGQSNMQWPVRYAANPEKEIAAGNHPTLRLFMTEKHGAAESRDDCEGSWEECTFRTVDDFSAAAYFFGRELTYETGVPIGLIQSAWGGTPAETWTTIGALEAEPALAPVLDGWEAILDSKPAELVEYYDLVASWFVFAFVCMGQKEPYGKLPEPPEGYKKALWAPSWLYNAMIAPLTSFPITGVIWYQGESNAGRAYAYRTLFPALIRGWRKQWGQGNFPFLFAQLSTTRKRNPEPSESAWAELREAQLMTLALPNTAMAVTVDIGEEDVHFKNKQEAGRRLALAALKLAYGRDIVYSGPINQSVSFVDGAVRIGFSHAESGLATNDGGPVRGFTIAGADSVFVHADARIENDCIVVSNAGIAKPLAVRYGWADNPDCNLCNREGLPASPFRTDAWRGVTEK